MYSNPPRVESRGLGAGLLAGFFGWFVTLGLIVGIGVLVADTGSHGLAVVPPQALFIVVLGICPWLARPTSWGVPVLYGLLSIPGLLVTLLLATVTTTTLATHRSPVALLADGAFLGAFTRGYVSDPVSVLAHAGTVVLIVLSSVVAVAVFRSRARRGPARAGPPGPLRPGPYGGPSPYAPQAHAGPAYPPVPAPAPPSGPGGAYPARPAAGYAPPQPAPEYGPPHRPGPAGPPPAAPYPPPSPVPAPPSAGGDRPGGTRRLDPDEFDQLLYEEEQARRAREDE